jgi:hypothetical protein
VRSVEDADRRIDELAKSGRLDPALMLTLAKAYSSTKDTDYTKEQVRDVMAHLYFKVRPTPPAPSVICSPLYAGLYPAACPPAIKSLQITVRIAGEQNRGSEGEGGIGCVWRFVLGEGGGGINCCSFQCMMHTTLWRKLDRWTSIA